jgi:alpha-tubulin suppressor-like RCC1 family protein
LVWLNQLEGLSPIAVCDACGLGIKADGTLWGIGSNRAGELGDGTQQSQDDLVQIGHRRDWLAIANFYMTSVGITADGSVWAWGNRFDRPIRFPTVKWRVGQWIRKLGLRTDLGESLGFVTSRSPELVLKFVPPRADATPTNTTPSSPGR